MALDIEMDDPIEDEELEQEGAGAENEPEDRGDNLEPEASSPVANDGDVKFTLDELNELLGAGDPAATTPPQQEESAGDDGKKTGIPQSRFNKVNNDRKQALEELERMKQENERLRLLTQQSSQQTDGFDLKAKVREKNAALLDGDADLASEIEAEIEAHRIAVAEQRALQRMLEQGENSAANHQKALLDYETDRVLTENPILNTKEGEALLQMVVAMRDHKMATENLPPHIALREATQSVMAMANASKGHNPTSGLQNTKGVVDNRTQNAIKRGVKVNENQPPVVQAGIGSRASSSSPSDITRMTDEQYRAFMKSEEYKKARGDY